MFTKRYFVIIVPYDHFYEAIHIYKRTAAIFFDNNDIKPTIIRQVGSDSKGQRGVSLLRVRLRGNIQLLDSSLFAP